jgi:hypothetical protein
MEVKAQYYFMLSVADKALGVAYAPPECRFDLIGEGLSPEHWEPVTFLLKDGGFADYQVNDLSWHLCSERLRLVIDTHASAQDVRQWLSAIVIGPGGEAQRYHILHLPERPDVLDKRRTLYAAKDVVVKAHLNARAAAPHHVFSFRGSETRIIVSAEVRSAILSAGCTGVDFLRVPAS